MRASLEFCLTRIFSKLNSESHFIYKLPSTRQPSNTTIGFWLTPTHAWRKGIKEIGAAGKVYSVQKDRIKMKTKRSIQVVDLSIELLHRCSSIVRVCHPKKQCTATYNETIVRLFICYEMGLIQLVHVLSIPGYLVCLIITLIVSIFVIRAVINLN